MGCQELVPEPSIERFTEGVVGGLSGTREAQLYSSAVRPGIQSLPSKLWPVIQANRFG